MEFVDRVSAYPGRYIMTTADGGVSYVVLERADEPTVAGTPLNAETFNGMLAELHPARESAAYPSCYYRQVDGENEWLNPPMVAGALYRTTERYKGLPVYVQSASFVMPGDNAPGRISGPPAGSEIVNAYAVAEYMDGAIKISAVHSNITFREAEGSEYTFGLIEGPPAGASVVVTVKYVKE